MLGVGTVAAGSRLDGCVARGSECSGASPPRGVRDSSADLKTLVGAVALPGSASVAGLALPSSAKGSTVSGTGSGCDGVTGARSKGAAFAVNSAAPLMGDAGASCDACTVSVVEGDSVDRDSPFGARSPVCVSRSSHEGALISLANGSVANASGTDGVDGVTAAAGSAVAETPAARVGSAASLDCARCGGVVAGCVGAADLPVTRSNNREISEGRPLSCGKPAGVCSVPLPVPGRASSNATGV